MACFRTRFLLRLEAAVGRATFDQFIHTYIQKFKFKSITTEKFVALLAEELPTALEQVDINEWLYEPGFPDSAPPVDSRLMNEVGLQLEKLNEGILPTEADVGHWTTHQTHYFLLKAPNEMPLDDVLHIESLFSLKESNNAFLLAPFYAIAIHSGYQEILPRAEQFISEVGRIIFTGRVYRAMAQTDWARSMARPLLDRYRRRYHPLTVEYIERILSQEGL